MLTIKIKIKIKKKEDFLAKLDKKFINSTLYSLYKLKEKTNRLFSIYPKKSYSDNADADADWLF